jgi:hypothetical protein
MIFWLALLGLGGAPESDFLVVEVDVFKSFAFDTADLAVPLADTPAVIGFEEPGAFPLITLPGLLFFYGDKLFLAAPSAAV